MKVKPLAPIATANIKHSTSPSQINIKCHTKGLFTSVPIIRHVWLLGKELQGILKGKKKHSLKTNGSIRTRLRSGTNFGIIIWNLKELVNI